eukprot:9500347-Pyramimonas_sp.AAC.1
MELSCDYTNAPANNAGCLSCSTFHSSSQRSVHISACSSAPALRMENVTTLKPPDLVAMHEVVQAYGTHVKITVASDRRRCRWPDTRLALQ